MFDNNEDARQRIKELELENSQLRRELEKYRERKWGGRKKHDKNWQSSYNEFVAGFESGKKIAEIAQEGNISIRTAYRYKAYYEELNQKTNKNQ